MVPHPPGEREERDPREEDDPRDERDIRLPGDPRDIRDTREPGDPRDNEWRGRFVTRFQAAFIAGVAMTISSAILVTGFLLYGVEQDDLRESQVETDYALCLIGAANREGIVDQAERGARTLGNEAIQSAMEEGASDAEIKRTRERIEEFVKHTRADAEKGLPPITCVRVVP